MWAENCSHNNLHLFDDGVAIPDHVPAMATNNIQNNANTAVIEEYIGYPIVAKARHVAKNTT